MTGNKLNDTGDLFSFSALKFLMMINFESDMWHMSLHRWENPS